MILGVAIRTHVLPVKLLLVERECGNTNRLTPDGLFIAQISDTLDSLFPVSLDSL